MANVKGCQSNKSHEYLCELCSDPHSDLKECAKCNMLACKDCYDDDDHQAECFDKKFDEESDDDDVDDDDRR